MAETVADAQVVILADVSKFAADLEKKLKPLISKINGTVDILANLQKFDSSVTKAVEKVNKTTANIDVNADTTHASEQVRREKISIDKTNATIDVNVDVDKRNLGGFLDKFSNVGGDAGKAFSSGLGESILPGISSIGSTIPATLTNPIGDAVGGAVAGLGLIPLGAAGATAALGGLGLGFLGLGAFALKGNKQVADSFAKLKTTISNTLSSAAEPLVEPFTKAFDTIGKAVESLGPDLRDNFAALAPAIQPLADGLAEFIKNLEPGLTDALNAAEPILEQLGMELPGLGDTLSQFFSIIAISGPGAVDLLKVAFGILEAAILGLGFFILGASTLFHGLYAAVSVVIEIFGQLYTTVSNTLAQLPGIFVNAVTTIENVVLIGLSAVIGFFSALPGNIFSVLSGLVGTVAGIFYNVFSTAQNIAYSGIYSIVNIIRQLPGQVISVLQSLASAAFSAGANIVSQIIAGIRSRLGALAGVAGSIGSTIKNLVPGFATGGVVTKPTLAMVGEAGPEAIIPLSGSRGGSGTVNNKTISPTINVSMGSSNPNMVANHIVRRMLAVGV